MCLQTTWKKPKVAKEDIVVYKLVEKLATDEGLKYYSPYADAKIEYKIGEEYSTEMSLSGNGDHLDIEAAEAIMRAQGKTIRNIGPGFHAAMTIERLKRLKLSYFEILKAIIPEGAKYYEGLSDLIVSDRLKIIEVVEIKKK